MDATIQSVVALLKSCVTGIGEELTEKIDLLPLLPLFRQHQITSMIYDGALLCGYSMNDTAMQQLFQSYCRLLQKCIGQESEAASLYQCFENSEIDYMPLKGSILRAYYPKPEYRYMGDADILIRLDQYDRIKRILEDRGYEFVLESDHELIWRSRHMLVELHKQLIPDKNTGFKEYFGDGWKLAKKQEGFRYTMSTEDNFLFLLTHFAKHYQDGGVGFRYVTDLWLYMQKHPDLDMVYVQQELEKLHLSVFVKNLFELMSVWFDGKPSTDLTDAMSQFIYDGGSWGTTSSRLNSMILRNKNSAHIHTNSKFLYILGVMFPSRKMLQGKYKILQKAPWMLPVIWLIRPFYKLIFERKSAVDKIGHVHDVSDDGVLMHQKMLEYVGLDFDI